YMQVEDRSAGVLSFGCCLPEVEFPLIGRHPVFALRQVLAADFDPRLRAQNLPDFNMAAVLELAETGLKRNPLLERGVDGLWRLMCVLVPEIVAEFDQCLDR